MGRDDVTLQRWFCGECGYETRAETRPICGQHMSHGFMAMLQSSGGEFVSETIPPRLREADTVMRQRSAVEMIEP